MIHHDTITVRLQVKVGENSAGQPIYDTVTRQVNGTVTWLDSAAMIDLAGNRLQSRLRIILSPFDKAIPPNVGDKLTLSWGPFGTLYPDGAVEPHYLRGRLHHYEVIAKALTT